MGEPLRLIDDGNPWASVGLQDPRARQLADRHYSRQQPGTSQILPPGRRLLLLTDDAAAVWGVCENLDPIGRRHWRVTLFRREAAARARCSDLVRMATDATIAHWIRKYGGLPAAPLRTEVDPGHVRHKRDPGRCFLRAGWRVVGRVASHRHRGALVLEAPAPASGWGATK